MFQQLWAGVYFAEISRIGKKQSKAVPQFDIPLTAAWVQLACEQSPGGEKNSLATLELEKRA